MHHRGQQRSGVSDFYPDRRQYDRAAAASIGSGKGKRLPYAYVRRMVKHPSEGAALPMRIADLLGQQAVVAAVSVPHATIFRSPCERRQGDESRATVTDERTAFFMQLISAALREEGLGGEVTVPVIRNRPIAIYPNMVLALRLDASTLRREQAVFSRILGYLRIATPKTEDDDNPFHYSLVRLRPWAAERLRRSDPSKSKMLEPIELPAAIVLDKPELHLNDTAHQLAASLATGGNSARLDGHLYHGHDASPGNDAYNYERA